MASERDFDNVTCVWSIVRISLKRDLRLKFQHLSSIFHSFAVFCRPLCMLLNSSRKNQTVGGQKKIYILFRLVYVIF